MLSTGAKVAITLVVLISAGFGAVFYLFPFEGRSEELKVATLRGACGVSFTEVLDALHLDREFGLDVEMVPLQGVPLEVEALLRGEVDVAIIPVEFLPQYVGEGAELRLLLLDATQYQALVSGPGVNSIDELQGKTIGVFTPTSTYLTLQAYLLENGLRISDDGRSADTVSIVNVPIPAMSDALESGEVDAIATIGPTTITSIERGGSLISTFSEISQELGLATPAPLIVFVTTDSKLEEKRAAIDTLVRAREQAVTEWLESSTVVEKLYVEICGLPDELAAKYHEWITRHVWTGEPLGIEVEQSITDHIRLLDTHGVIETQGLEAEEVVGRLLGR